VSTQLPLPLGTVPRYGLEDFLVGKPNAQAFAYIERWPRWLAPAVLLVGPEGAGKTHLAAIFAEAAEAQVMRADRLTFEAVPLLSRARAVVLEDADRYPADEVALFHLLNLARETGVFVVITARTPPDLWRVKTPDLLSRLRREPRLELHEPDDALLGALLLKHFSDRQITLEATVARYALARIERSYAGVQNLVAALDRESLIRKKPITRALVAEMLGEENGQENADEGEDEPQA
jgi:chromosomal replication initiation ATPase DnaA